ncbi:MAG: T9SS type A sorting domain-containing protein [Candidatus Eisenbacteria bacterium]|nr:T9SS type A sorting domain-containing protein [Candidatus Eisenbacteria bacterium]
MRPVISVLLLVLLISAPALAAPKKALFDFTKSETAGQSDWIIDTDMPVPAPAQTGITAGTAENYWLGGISAWGVAMVKRGYTVATLTSAYGITYGNMANPHDLSNYDVFIIPEPQNPFSAAETTAIFAFLRNGGGIVAVGDHNSSDRDSDGWDSPRVYNALDPGHVLGVHWGVTGDPSNSISQVSTNVSSSPTDSIIHGPFGTVSNLSFHAGNTFTLYPATNPTVRGNVWMNGASQAGTTQAMVASSVYGNGRIVFVGDSSPMDDGTGQPGNTLFTGWTEAGTTDSSVFMNAAIWVTRRDAGAGDTIPPVVTITSPVGGESWALGSAHNITWTATDAVGVTSVDLAYSVDGGATFPNVIATGLANSGSYSWTLGGLPSATARVRAIAHDAAGHVGSDSSHANFTIAGWTITASAGANGSIAPSGTIGVADGASPTFTMTPVAGYHVADVLVNGISEGAAAGYTFAPVHANQTISVSFAVNTSDTQAPVVTVTAPVGGESWAIGSSQNITWTATDNVGVTSVDLAYSSNGGATFPTVIASGIANSGSHAWTVAGLPTATARVRVTAHDGAGNAGRDSSHANFALTGWTVTATAGANGSISPGGAIGVGDGATPSFAITPSAGYHVADVLVNGGSVGAVTDYTFPAVHADQTISASFDPSSYTVNITTVGGGTVAKSPDQPDYLGGSTVQLTANPTVGWVFAGWSGDASGATNPLNVLIDGNKNITATFSQHAYVWNQAGTAAYGTATNWTPTRTTPATDDVLIFNGGGMVTVTGVPAQTIGQLQLSNNSSVALQPSAAVTLALSGASGLALDVAAGSALLLNGTSALTLQLSAGTTGTVRGAVTVGGAAHRMIVGSASGLSFQSGAVLTLGTGFSGNFFGTGVAPGALNSAVFQSGSLMIQSAGANPFGASAPNAVTVFQHGSRFRMDGSLTPSVSGRTYADFELNNAAASLAPTGSNAWIMDSLIVSAGTLNLGSLTGGGTLKGNVVVRSGATLTFSPAGALTLALGGTAPQAILVQGTLNTSATSNIAVNNASGVSLLSNVTLSGGLMFALGNLTTGGSALTMGSTGSVSGAAQSTGWVVGNLHRSMAAGAPTVRFDVGDALRYSPATVTMSGNSGVFDLAATCATPDHPSLAASDLDPAKSVNRWWSLTPTGTPSFTGYDVTLAYPAGDVDGGASTAAFLVRRYSGGWNPTAIGARTATSTQATGLTGWGDFAVAEFKVPSYTITATAGSNGSITPSGAVSVNVGGSQHFSITPAPAYVVADVLVDGVSVGPDTAYTFTNVTANHTIDVAFTSGVIVGVGGGPRVLALYPSRPNPSTGSVTLRFSLPEGGRAVLEVMDVGGRVVRRVDEPFPAGPHSWTWDGRTTAGSRAGAGMYFLRLQTQWGTKTGRLVRVG